MKPAQLNCHVWHFSVHPTDCAGLFEACLFCVRATAGLFYCRTFWVLSSGSSQSKGTRKSFWGLLCPRRLFGALVCTKRHHSTVCTSVGLGLLKPFQDCSLLLDPERNGGDPWPLCPSFKMGQRNCEHSPDWGWMSPQQCHRYRADSGSGTAITAIVYSVLS